MNNKSICQVGRPFDQASSGARCRSRSWRQWSTGYRFAWRVLVMWCCRFGTGGRVHSFVRGCDEGTARPLAQPRTADIVSRSGARANPRLESSEFEMNANHVLETIPAQNCETLGRDCIHFDDIVRIPVQQPISKVTIGTSNLNRED